MKANQELAVQAQAAVETLSTPAFRAIQAGNKMLSFLNATSGEAQFELDRQENIATIVGHTNSPAGVVGVDVDTAGSLSAAGKCTLAELVTMLTQTAVKSALLPGETRVVENEIALNYIDELHATFRTGACVTRMC